MAITASSSDEVTSLERKIEALTVELARSRAEHSAAVEQQAAISGVLSVISREKLELQPVLNAVAESAARICGGDDVRLLRVVGDRLRSVADTRETPTGPTASQTGIPITRGTVSGRSFLEKRTIQVEDLCQVLDEYPDAVEFQRISGHRTTLATPLIHDGRALGVLLIRRRVVQPFTDKQTGLLETFADQAVIAIENARLFEAERARTREVEAKSAELQESLEQQTATAEILRVISSSPGDLKPAFTAIARSAVQLCGALFSSVFSYDGSQLEFVAQYGLPANAIRTLASQYPRPPRGTNLESVETRDIVHIPDVHKDTRTANADLVQTLGYRSSLTVPMLQHGRAIGTIVIYGLEPKPFTDAQVALVRVFANQAVIAIENARLFEAEQARTRELTESLDYQTATSEVLSVISRSPQDLQPVFDVIARTAWRLCEAEGATIFTRQADGRLRMVAIEDPAMVLDYGDKLTATPLLPERGSITGRTALEGRAVHVHNVQEDPEFSLFKGQGPDRRRTMLGVPLLREGAVIGVITLTRIEVKPFTQAQIDLVATFADQAAIAINNVRLFQEVQARTKELTESLEYQIAISEVLGVISRTPSDLQTIMDVIAENASRVCGRCDAAVCRTDGDVLRPFARTGSLPWGATALQAGIAITRGTVVGRALLDRRTVHVEDLLAELDQYPEARVHQQEAGHRTTLVTPLLRDETVLGVIMMRRNEVKPFSPNEIRILETFADQAVIAIENARLFEAEQTRTKELQESLTHQTATADILRVIAASRTDIRPVLATVAETACRICDTYDAVITLREGDWLKLAAHHGPLPFDVDGIPLKTTHSTCRAVIEGRPIHVADILSEGDLYPDAAELARRHGWRAVLAVPLMRNGVAIGAIGLRRVEPKVFTEKQIQSAQTFADQAVIAIENARLLDELQTRQKELEARSKELTESLEYQTATSKVLSVISRSPGNVQPVLDAILSTAQELCEADRSSLWRLQSGKIELAAHKDHWPGHADYLVQNPVPNDSTSLAGRVIAERRTIHIDDRLSDIEIPANEQARTMQARTMLGVPLVLDGQPIGTISLVRSAVRPFTSRQIALVETFADQAVIAIENARLLDELQTRQNELEARSKELSESLEYQTAISEVLAVISKSPNELQPVLDSIVGTARRLCGSEYSGIFMKGEDGAFRIAGADGASFDLQEYLRSHPLPMGRGSGVGRAALERKTVQIADALADPEFTNLNAQQVGNFRTLLSVPLLRDGEVVAVIALAHTKVQPFTRRQIDLITTFADQAVIAMNNARLFEEVQARTKELQESLEYQTATSEVLNIISRSKFELQPVFDAIVESGLKLFPGAAVVITLPDDGKVNAAAVAESDPERVAAIRRQFPVALSRDYMHSIAILDHRVVDIPDASNVPPDLAIGAAAFLASGNRAITIMPMLRGDQAIGALSVMRLTPGPLSAKQVELLRTFADQAVIAINNVGLFEEVQARTKEVESRSAELAQSLEYQTATSEVLSVISRSPDQLQPVLDTIAETAVRLCKADRAFFNVVRGGQIPLMATFGAPADVVADVKARQLVPDRSSSAGRALLERRPVHIPDARLDPEFTLYDANDPRRARSMVSVPLVKGDGVVGVISVVRLPAIPFTQRQIALLQTFADQAVIAINNVGLFEEVQTRTKELTESLEYQTATSEVLGVISRSPNELQPVLDAIVATAVDLCEAQYGQIFSRGADGLFRYAASQNAAPEFVEWVKSHPISAGDGSAVGIVAVDKRTLHLADALSDARFTDHSRQRQSKARTMLAVPLMRQGEVSGVIFLARTEVKPFSNRQIDLVTTFADQAVIAINNVGLFEEVQARTREVTESLEYQTATSEVLSVISKSPSELQPVLDAIVTTAAELCEADFAHFRILRDGIYHLAAANHDDAQLLQAEQNHPIAPSRNSTTGRAAIELRTVHIPDVLADSEHTYFQRSGSSLSRTLLAVPIVQDNKAIGVIVLFRKVMRPFTERQIQQVTTFADQALIAINNTRLFEEVQARTKELTESLEYQTATSEVLGVISSSPNELQPVLDVITNTAVRLCQATHGHVRLLRDDGAFHIVAHQIPDPELLQQMRDHPFRRGTDSVAGRAALRGETVYVYDVAADPEIGGFQRRISDKVRTAMSVPLKRNGVVVGLISVFHTRVQPFTDRQIALVETFADQAVIAINNTRLFEEVQARTKELARSVEELQSLGEVGQAVSSTLDMGTVLQTVLENAARMAFASGGTIYVYDNATQEFHLEAGYNMSEEHTARVKAQPIRMGEPVVGECAATRAAVQIEDLTLADRTRTPLLDILMRAGVRSILALPLLHQDEVIGALVVRRNYPGAFTPETVRLLEAFAAQSAIAVHNARLFKEIEQKGRELEIASQHKSQFVANMSHELRTPLAAMLGYTELLRDGTFGELPEKSVRVVDRVQVNGRHLLGLINTVLDISKIEAGQFSLNLAEYSLTSLIETVRVGTDSLANAKKLTLVTEVTPGLPRGFGDEQRLAQVLLNLVGNAIKFTDRGEVRIIARTEEGQFLVTVRDTGPGIPAEEQSRIFEEFHQVDNSSTRAKGGTGLGLAIAKKIVDMHGGNIRVESAPDAGAAFYVRLPVTTPKL